MALQAPYRSQAVDHSVRSGEDRAHLSYVVISIVVMAALLVAGFLLGRYVAPSSASPQPAAAAVPAPAPGAVAVRETFPHSLLAPLARVAAATGGGLQSGYGDPAAVTRHFAAPTAGAPQTGSSPGPRSHSRLGPVVR